MTDEFFLDIEQSVNADSGCWYKNIQVLGSGGNATTFLVVATSGSFKGNLFALKVFRQLSKPERRESFLQEIKFLRTCNHPNIMRVYDEGVFKEQFPFVIAEYLISTLHSLIRAGSLATPAKLSYALQLLSALVFLSNLDEPVIHRDVKPQNIFVKGHSCVLGDFGLLKRTNRETSEDRITFKESVGVGMPYRYRTQDLVDYLNAGKPPTPKSDVFQLGLVLAELFTGKNPQRPTHSFTDPVELDALEKVPGAMGAAIANLIGRMLVLNPEDRDLPTQFMDPWQGIFFDAVKRAHALDGKVF